MRILLRCLVVVGIGTVVLTTGGCGEAKPTPPPGLPDAYMAGWQVYADLNCASCHGDLREGKRSGPVLTGLETHWTRDQLVEYVKNPDAMIKSNPRLAYKAEKYPIAMPGYADKADEANLGALAGYLLYDLE